MSGQITIAAALFALLAVIYEVWRRTTEERYMIYFPWYAAAWRLVWFLPYTAVRSLLVLIVLAMAGPREARHLWNDTR